MKTFEALQRSISGQTVAHAKELHLSTSLVNKWQEPTTDFSDSGAYNPLDRIETIIETSHKLGTPRPDALAPIQFLAHRFNAVLIPLPEASPCLKNLHAQLSTAVIEFGHLMEKSAIAMADGVISHDERRTIEGATQHLMHHLGVYSQLIAEACEK